MPEYFLVGTILALLFAVTSHTYIDEIYTMGTVQLLVFGTITAFIWTLFWPIMILGMVIGGIYSMAKDQREEALKNKQEH